MAKRYRVLVTLRYPINPRAKRENWEWKRVRPGTVVEDIPTISVAGLLAKGAIELVDEESAT